MSQIFIANNHMTRTHILEIKKRNNNNNLHLMLVFFLLFILESHLFFLSAAVSFMPSWILTNKSVTEFE